MYVRSRIFFLKLSFVVPINKISENFLIFTLKAGISTPETPDQLIIALEPEGAAIFCRECRLTDFLDEKGDATLADILGEDSKYLVLDIGGMM